MVKRKKPLEKFSKRWYDKECMKLAKQVVKIRDLDTCQKCWKKWPWLHCSHVIADWKDTRLSVDTWNMKLLCYRCHFKRWHLQPFEASEWFKNEFPERYEYLLEKHKEPQTWSIELERWETRYAELKEELQNMKDVMASYWLYGL